jgi:hypothetical protein
MAIARCEPTSLPPFFLGLAVLQLARNKETGEQVAIKFIERGDRVNKYVEAEILNHRMLRHPHVIEVRRPLVKECSSTLPATVDNQMCRCDRQGPTEPSITVLPTVQGGVSDARVHLHRDGVCNR